jgi:hypothetical protein
MKGAKKMRINNLLISHPNVSNSAVIVYMLLCHLAEVGGKFNRQVECNIKDMIALRQMSDRTIRTAIKQLVSEGIITVQHYNHGPSKYYLCEIEDPEPPKPRKTEEKPKITAENTAAKENSFKDNNNNNIFKTNISEYQNQISDNDPVWDDPIFHDLCKERVNAVRQVYRQLKHWRGTKPLYIGSDGKGSKIAYLPEAVKIRMELLTAEQLASVVKMYEPTRIEHPTSWIQASLMKPMKLQAPVSHAEQRPAPSSPAHHKPVNKAHFALERSYDVASIEADLVGKPLPAEA